MTKLKSTPLSPEMKLRLREVKERYFGELVLSGQYYLVAANEEQAEVDRPNSAVAAPISEDAMDGLVKALLETAKERAGLLASIRRALEQERHDDALRMLSDYVNLTPKKG